MNCEQVKELLSAFLDNKLATEEYRGVTAHLRECPRCRSILADYRRFDALLAQLPRISPSPVLRDRIFSSPEYLELTGTYDTKTGISREQTIPIRPLRRNTAGRPQLVAMPGGRSTQPKQPADPGRLHDFTLPLPRGRRRFWRLRLTQAVVAAVVLLALAVGGLIGRGLWLQQVGMANANGAITPPAGLQQQGVPFPVGMRFVFLRDGALWSIAANGSSPVARLTPPTVTVASNWVVSPPLPGRSAGDMLAYIDLQHAQLHTIRSDGQDDTIVAQPLLKAGIAPSSVWDTPTGAAILNGLTWSKDGNMLAFVADPSGTGLTNLYVRSTETGSVQQVPLTVRGSVSHPAWSPDGIRVAFEFTAGNTVSIMDYNTQNRGLLTITNEIAQIANFSDSILALSWSPNINTPAITWSVGSMGHVHSIWIRHVGVEVGLRPQLLASGDYADAIYSPDGHNGLGSWLLMTSIAGHQGDLWYVDAFSGAAPRLLTRGKQVGLAWWSPDGDEVSYLDSVVSGVGALHVVNLITGGDALIAGSVVDEPTPAWSADSHRLVFSTGLQTIVADLPTGKRLALKLKGLPAMLVWSASSPDQVVVAINDSQQGIYLVDVVRNTSVQLDTRGLSSAVLWTEVP